MYDSFIICSKMRRMGETKRTTDLVSKLKMIVMFYCKLFSVISPVLNFQLGLWEACFNHWTYFNDYNGKIYDGCWWIYSYEYKPIFHWINPCTYFRCYQVFCF